MTGVCMTSLSDILVARALCAVYMGCRINV
nr:MAG TPA: hypothetical protein [Caudoviricetes sp.]